MFGTVPLSPGLPAPTALTSDQTSSTFIAPDVPTESSFDFFGSLDNPPPIVDEFVPSKPHVNTPGALDNPPPVAGNILNFESKLTDNISIEVLASTKETSDFIQVSDLAAESSAMNNTIATSEELTATPTGEAAVDSETSAPAVSIEATIPFEPSTDVEDDEDVASSDLFTKMSLPPSASKEPFFLPESDTTEVPLVFVVIFLLHAYYLFEYLVNLKLVPYFIVC